MNHNESPEKNLKNRKKIVFLSFVIKPWNFEKRYFINELIANGFEIEFWDLSIIFNVDIGRISDPSHVKKFESRGFVQNHIEKNKSAFYVVMFDLEYRFLWVYRLLTKHECKLFFFSSGQFPTIPKTFSQKLLDSLRSPTRIFHKIFMYIVNRMKMIKKFDIVFFDSNRARELYPGAKQYVAIGSPEFEEYCRLSRSLTPTEKIVEISEEKYLVFLDSCLPFNSDPKRNSLQNVDSEKYRTGILNLFNKIETETGMRIIIAAHPKSNYSSNYFQNRPIIKWKTSQLVLGAQGVISHYSTATNYAVLMKKQIMFICNDEFGTLPGARHRMLITSAMAQELQMSFYNMDHLPEEISFFEVKEEIYRKYKENYVSINDSCENNNSDIILKTFLENLPGREYHASV